MIGIFGFEQVDQIEFWLPLFMFTILFGLSMDYHVFMLSRIKENYDETKSANFNSKKEFLDHIYAKKLEFIPEINDKTKQSPQIPDSLCDL